MSNERFWLSFWAMTFTTVLIAFLIALTLGSDTPQVQVLKLESDHNLQMNCIQMKGEWSFINENSSDWGKTCRFK